MIRNVVHVNVNVSDLDRSVAFYERLGFAVMHRFGSATRDRDDPAAGAMAFGGRLLRGAVMSLGDHPHAATKLELIEWIEPRAEPPPERPHHRVGVARIALRTKGLLATCERLRRAGVVFELEPSDVALVGARRFALFRDPDGTLLELVEFTPRESAPAATGSGV